MFNLKLRNSASNSFQVKVNWSEHPALTLGLYDVEQFDAIVKLISSSMNNEDRAYYKTDIELHFAESMFCDRDDRELGMRLDINADEPSLQAGLDRRLNYWLQMPVTQVNQFREENPAYVESTERLINAWMVARRCYREQMGLAA